MRVTVIGQVDQPAAIVVGSWDPLLPGHLALFRRLRKYARHHSLASVVVHLHPSPTRQLNGPLERPTYDDIKARLDMVAQCGVTASILVRFRKQDLTAGAKEFIGSVTQHVKIKELWLGAQQSLGSLESGSSEAISKLAKKHQFTVVRLPYSVQAAGGRKVRQYLKNGDLGEATRIVGHSPVWAKPRSGLLRLAWRPGNYIVALLSSPSGQTGQTMVLKLAASGQGVPKCRWPDPAIRWLTFIDRAQD